MPVKDFVQEMRSGQTPAQIAEAHGSSGDALIDAIVTAEKARLDKAVAEGRLTQEQADEILANLTEKATEWVQNGFPKPPHPH
jgi:phage-related minor tail protein